MIRAHLSIPLWPGHYPGSRIGFSITFYLDDGDNPQHGRSAIVTCGILRTELDRRWVEQIKTARREFEASV